MKDEETHEKQGPGIGTIIAIVIMCVLGLGASYFCFSLPTREERMDRKNQKQLEMKTGVWKVSRELIKMHLKSPDTAKFWGEDPRINVIDHKNGEYTVKGTVRSRNSLVHYWLRIRYKGSGQWTLLGGPTFYE